MKKILQIISFIPAILVMLIIFNFSAQDSSQSSRHSEKVSRAVIHTVLKLKGEKADKNSIAKYISNIEGVIRKVAHMSEYAALALTVALPLVVYGSKKKKLYSLTALICISYACFDEYHQTFVPGRSGSVRDVIIDSIGICAGILLVKIISRNRKANES